MKLFIVPALIGIFAGILAACGNPAPPPSSPTALKTEAAAPVKAAWEQKWDSAVAEGKKEGEVVVYTSQAANTIKQTGDAFKSKYGINVSVLSGRGPEILQKVVSEQRGGLYIPDIIMAGGTNIVFSFKPQGLLDKIDPVLILPEVTDPRAWITGAVPYYDKEHYGIGMIASTQRYVLRNTDMVKPDAVKSYKDLVEPKWKGKVALNDPTVTGSGNSFMAYLVAGVWNMDETKEFMRALVKQEVVLSRENRQLIEWIARGKYEIALAPHRETVAEFINLGAPVDLVRTIEPAKVGAAGGGLSVMAKRPHPNATTVYVNWLLSKEGHAVFVKAFGNPGARVDAPTEGLPRILFVDPGEKAYAETEETFLLEGEMLGVAKDIFAPLLK